MDYSAGLICMDAEGIPLILNTLSNAVAANWRRFNILNPWTEFTILSPFLQIVR